MVPPRRRITARLHLHALTTRAAHLAANRQLARLFREAGARRVIAPLYEGRLPGLYLPEQDIWLVAHVLDNRFRNALGVGDPRSIRAPSPSVQLNLARAPGSARPRARFARDARGELWLAHSGTLGGRQPGISRTRFVELLGGSRAVLIDDREEQLVVLGTFARPAPLLAQIANLTRAAHGFRSALAAGLGP